MNPKDIELLILLTTSLTSLSPFAPQEKGKEIVEHKEEKKDNQELILAIKNNKLDKIDEANVTDLDSLIIDKDPLLIWAVKRGKKDLAEKLIDKGINLKVKDKGGKNALHWADITGKTEIAKLIRSKS